jgi:hypothetical protein
MSFASQTWTMDSSTTPWVLPDGITTILTDNAQTLAFTGTDTGDGGTYVPRTASTLTLQDGAKIRLELDKNLTNFRAEADGASVRCGSIWVVDDDGRRTEVNITTMTVTDGDAVGANNIANITFEYPGKPYQWSWTNVNTA